MTSRERIADQISEVEKFLGVVERLSETTLEQLEQDEILRGAVERYLYLATQAAIDLGETIIAYQGLRKPREYREIFEILGERGLLDEELVARLVQMVGFRNILAHGYIQLRLETVVRVLQEDRNDIVAFLTAIKKEFSA